MGALGCPHSYEGAIDFIRKNPSFTESSGPDKDCRIEYQARIGGFIVERINTIFWQLSQYPRELQQIKLAGQNQII